MRTSIRHIGAGLLLAALAAPVAVYAQVTYPFDLPAQDLGDSLRTLGTQARISVIFDPLVIKDRKAPALKGSYTAKQALTHLLEGTGYAAEFIDSTTAVIKPKPPQPPSGRTERSGDKPVELPEARSITSASKLDTVTVLGSLLPRASIETASPLTIVTAEDMKTRGFSNVADALQNLSVNTGAVLNTSINAGDIWAAKSLSLFGLPQNFTKFLVDGRPMPNYSQINESSSADLSIVNLTGIPIDMIDHVELLPGGQSSLYGSDAMAGVVNIVLRKNVEYGAFDVLYGGYPNGGGRQRKISFNDSFHLGNLNLTVGAQINDTEPIWSYQRRVTAQNFADGDSPQQADGIASVLGLLTRNYYSPGPAQCAQLAGLWRGSVQLVQTSTGDYCGSVRDRGYETLTNKDQGASVNAHATYAVNDRFQLYADLFDSYEKQSQTLQAYLSGLYYDPNLRDLILLERTFAPEEIGTRLNDSLLQKQYENTASATLGGKGDFGGGWTLDVGLTRSLERVDDRQTALLTSGLPKRFFGAQLGTFAGFPVYAPNYAMLYAPLTPAQMSAYLGSASIASTSRNDLVRAQLNQTSLFSLPGGDAGLALVAEKGFESWKYVPAAILTSGELQGLAWNPSDGHRDRYGAGGELNLPLFKMLTVDLSARYDRYDVEGAAFDHATWGGGIEFRPVDALLLRGRIGTSFKAPDLIDEFEGTSTHVWPYAIDYLACAKLGFVGTGRGNCPAQYTNVSITWKELSNPKLQPITSRSWSYGLVWSPLSTLSLSVDYQHIDIRGEVLKENPGYLTSRELYCANGTLPATSPSCQAVRTQIIRGPVVPGSSLPGPLIEIDTTKINLAHELNNSLTANLQYRFDIGQYGRLAWDAAYTVVLTHGRQTFPGDPQLDYLREPTYSTDFKTKFNAGVTWSNKGWSATLYGTRYGKTPNWAARNSGNYSNPGANTLPPWMIYNASLSYAPIAALRLSLRINNLMNSMPPFDRTEFSRANHPFKPGNYNPYGRQILLEAKYQFGRSASN